MLAENMFVEDMCEEDVLAEDVHVPGARPVRGQRPRLEFGNQCVKGGDDPQSHLADSRSRSL